MVRSTGRFLEEEPKARIELDCGALDDAEEVIKPKESAHSYRRYVCCISNWKKARNGIDYGKPMKLSKVQWETEE